VIGLVPEGRQICPNLTVSENMLVTAANRLEARSPYTLDDVLSIFPRLADRHCIMDNGRVVWRGGSADLAGDEDLKARYLGV
jgi:ABC-type branched-subunit amino acid transport system ATPase component